MARTLAERYRLEEVVGRGGMSTVYRATDEVLGRTVAVKILLAALADQDPTYSLRFEREARAAAALASSAVVTVYDTGVDDGSQYIVMEYVAGRSLDEILRTGQPLEVSEALRVAARVAGALAAAHDAGILHRDVKPANVMLADDGTVKVLDFGIARNLDGTTITQAASVLGTAAYMAPERALGESGDAQADVYSLGCLLYAMLTGHPPFGGEISAAVLHQQINAEPRPPSETRAGISPALDALVLAMLAKAPGDRPAGAAEVRDRVMGLPEAPAAAGATAATARLAAETKPTAVMAGARLRARPGPLADHRRRALLMALATAAVTLIAVALLSGGGATPRRTSQSRPPTTRLPRAHTTSTAAHTTPAPPAPKPAGPKPGKGGPGKGGPGKGGPPPGHGGEPPGQAKKH